NFKWAKLLEQFNKLTPQIALKISQIADQSIERQNENLTKIRKLFLSLSDGNNLLDFYTDQELDISNISIDHFIPWSFIYSDDIWNLVPTSKSYNSSKSNKLPKEELIIKLNERNKKLLSILKLNPKYKDLVYDLENAICNNLVKEYYYICKM
ncbi:MAG: hypothetical protein LBV51_03645, partial [Acholeplasmatales bacterium]|nr:hypothetical protein [Acholeplasmatales bacterium]